MQVSSSDSPSSDLPLRSREMQTMSADGDPDQLGGCRAPGQSAQAGGAGPRARLGPANLQTRRGRP